MIQDEKERKKISLQIPFIHDPGKKIPKKIAKKIKKLIKSLYGVIFSQNWMRWAKKERKKFQFRIPFLLNSGKKIPKNVAKKFQKLKNLFPALFLAKTGGDRLRK